MASSIHPAVLPEPNGPDKEQFWATNARHWSATTSSQHQVQSLATHPISFPREPIRSSNTPIFTIQTIDITMETVNGKVRSDVWNLVTSSVTII
ncbi:uncharacterized protein FRV6_04720 [Fusarium oxysporum]|uniref:Uncharacterized protein n=1 Tax=Fusarium oxysporum TaxID=5507 RepID=A0A2H3SVQ8_FUSOX|nr:uncharacterized protein FRV6_04720 [Fusarium oxysporum]